MDFAEIFLSDGTIVSISMHLPSFLPKKSKSCLFACISLSVWIDLSVCRSSNECVLLTCCTRTCTLLLLILIARFNVVDEFLNYSSYF